METNETLAGVFTTTKSSLVSPSDLPTQIRLDDHPDTIEKEFQKHSVWTIVSLSIVYGLLSLTAFVGNTLVIWVICKYPSFLENETRKIEFSYPVKNVAFLLHGVCSL